MQESQSDAASDPIDTSANRPREPRTGSRVKIVLILIVSVGAAAAAGYTCSTWLVPSRSAPEGVSLASEQGNRAGAVRQAPDTASGASVSVSDQIPAFPPVRRRPEADDDIGPTRSIGMVVVFGNTIAERPQTIAQLTKEAERVADCLSSGFPGNPDALEVVARFNFQLGRCDQAKRIWQQAIELDPSYAYAYDGLGSVAAKKGEGKKAVNLFRKSLALNPNRFDTCLSLARALIDLGSTKEAIELLEQNIAKDSRPYRGRELLGLAYMQVMDYKRAKENYAAAVQALPTFSNALFGLATACARLGEKELSKEYYRKFHELRGKERVIASGDRIHFDDLGVYSADTAKMYTDSAAVCQAAGYWADAMALSRRAATLDPNSVDARQALAWLYLKRGKPDETIRMLEQLAKLRPKNFRYPMEIARLYAQMGRMEDAEQRLIELCDANPNDAVGYVALASHFLRFNVKTDKAVELARTAVSFNAIPANYLLLSTACEKTGDLPGAVAAMAEAVKLAPKNIQYRQMHELLKTRQSEQTEQNR